MELEKSRVREVINNEDGDSDSEAENELIEFEDKIQFRSPIHNNNESTDTSPKKYTRVTQLNTFKRTNGFYRRT